MKIIALILSLFLTGCFSIEDKLDFLNQDKIDSFIVKLDLIDSPITCQGIVISNTEILFLNHCLELEKDIAGVHQAPDVLIGEYFEPDLKLYGLNGKTNIRILDVKGFDKDQPTVKVSTNIVKNGDPITIIGFGCRNSFYSQKSTWNDNGMVVKWCSIYPGDAILNDAGELVGVVSQIDFGAITDQGMEKINLEKIVW